MNRQIEALGRGILSFAVTLAIGGGIAYAVFSSNTVTMAQSKLETGSANLRICNSSASTPIGSNTWQDSISPTISFSGLTPSTTGVDVMPGQDIYLGNDDGTLGDSISGGILCTSYASGITPGNSNITLKMMPSVSNVVCTEPGLSTAMELGFVYGTSTTGSYQSLEAWKTNTTASGTYAVGEAKSVKLKARLDPSYTQQNQSCTFDTTFVGQQ